MDAVISPSQDANNAKVASERPAPVPGHRRAVFVRWLRRVHGWIGLWGALLGLLFGSSGILMNHRAVLKIPALQTQDSNLQLPLGDAVIKSPDELATWLQAQLALDRPATRTREEKSRPAVWGDKNITQPAHWSVNFASPRSSFQADWWVGNTYVSVKRSDNNVFATLSNFHKGVGMSAAWILLVDTLAGSIILLSITGVILWTQLNRRRLLGAAILGVSVALTIGLIVRDL